MREKATAFGFQIRHEVRPTRTKGLGVFARDAIAQGTLVWRHVPGQYAVYDEAGFLALIAGRPRDQIIDELTHVFGLADFPGCLIRIFDDGVRINHDAAPNLRTNRGAGRKPTLEPGDLRAVAQALLQDRYALIAARDIAPGEELVMDYGEDVRDPPFYHRLCAEYGIEEDYFDETDRDGAAD